MADERMDRDEDLGLVEFPPGWAEYQEARNRWLAGATREGLALRMPAAEAPEAAPAQVTR